MNPFYESIKGVLQNARATAFRAVNFAMVDAYWNIGRLIVDEEQQGKSRAEYGTSLLKYLAQRLTTDFGKGFDEREMRRIRQFYLQFPIRDAVRPELTWTHYRLLSKVDNANTRTWYMNEAAEQQWSSRALERQINSLYYERLLATRETDRPDIRQEADEKTKPLQIKPEDVLKDPYILEFLNLQPNWKIYEKYLEQALLDNLQTFMLELGKGFAFVARQQRMVEDDDSFRVDLVFYNYILRCFVLVDLKVGKLTHQDVGQMDMYVRMYEDQHKQPGDNPTIGLILCTEKNETVVKYSVLNGSQQLFASKYKLFLPSEEELRHEIEREKVLIEQNRRNP
ncbi:YhcG family protein [Spirosoma sp. 209]|uniref:PDDEXK nuclease domain-containing protein n=1 Tax=Spirosoma sp. 209 TaxID=1955701 RepID=UPI00098D6767|nr:PDDEXK nuclease domain-containing protein [Spirosoma sp. 209]